MLKIPYGIIDYKDLKDNNYYYVDKTMYLEKLENIGKVLVYLRPGRFGKTLLTSMMSYYYDINSKNDFENLFKDTYVYNNPTKNKNNYYILKFDFSGIFSGEKESFDLEKEFKNTIKQSIEIFNKKYLTKIDVDFNNSPNGMLGEFITKFNSLNLEHKLYIIIDEYDNFTNAILEGNGDRFKSIVGNEGFIKAFYAIIKKYYGLGIVERVFITGICPITLDSMTTGFNISKDISTDIEFNAMIGLTHNEVSALIKDIDEIKKEEIFDLMVKNYDGYLFNSKSNDHIFNATLVMYFMDEYNRFQEIPSLLLDSNIAFNYGKIGNLLKLQNNKYYQEILDTILKTNEISGELKVKFNLEEDFSRDDIISLLYYFGYLTIKKSAFGRNLIFSIPNYAMTELYTNYFLKLLRDINVPISGNITNMFLEEIVLEGKIEKISKYIEKILKLADNRTFMKLDEKYVQLLYFGLLIGNKEFYIYNEFPCSNGYIDLMLFKNNELCKYDIMIELKYLKVRDYRRNRKLLEIKRQDAIDQLNSYSQDSRINKNTLKKYVVIFVGTNLKILEEV